MQKYEIDILNITLFIIIKEDYNKYFKNKQVISMFHNDNVERSFSKETEGSRYKALCPFLSTSPSSF